VSVNETSILGLGCAAPAHRQGQEDALAKSLEISPARSEEERRWIEAIFRRCGVQTRGVASGEGAADPLALLRAATLAAPLGASTGERMIAYAARAGPLSVSSARAALADSGVGAKGITHLITASCTGFGAPGWDLQIIERLGLSPSVLRTHVGFMGCHAAVNALRVADAFCRADAEARALVCCTEICSIHYQYAARPDQVVANALFADGSASAVLGQGMGGMARIGATASLVIPETGGQMGWVVGDHGFEMSLGTELPATIRTHAGPWLAEWLDKIGVGIAGVGGWAVHPGGPRVLGAVAEALGLAGGALGASRAVLGAHGNMSSATVLFILDHMRRSEHGIEKPTVVLSFGPGVAAEAVMLV
jgi:prepilin-type processing-associated H-X9-DG protein